MLLALLIVLGEGAIIALLLYFIRTFGAYTEVLVTVHQENLVLRKHLARAVQPVDVHEGLPEEELKGVA